MGFLDVVFPVSGVQTNLLLPPLVALVISFFTSMGGVSGAFLILPFQMSVFGYTSPSVSATNFIYNIVAIPGGAYRYIKEGRMAWALTAVVIAGTLPGVFMGYFLRVRFFPEPARFKLFVGLVLMYVGWRLLLGLKKGPEKAKTGPPGEGKIRTIKAGPARVEYEFSGKRYSFRTVPVFIISLLVGIVGGTYGIGGGAIIAPFFIAMLGLPVYIVAGAALMGTLITSVAGVAFYSLIPSELNTSPDWALGALFGLGGFVGMYLGARAQKYVPQKFIKLLLAAVVLFVSITYVLNYFI